MCPCFSVDKISHILLIPSEMENYKFHYLLFCFHNTHLFRSEWSYTHYDYHLQSARLRRGEPLGARCFGLTNQNNVKKKKKSCGQLLSAHKLQQASSTLPAPSGMADSQSKRMTGEVEVFVEPLAKQREADIYFRSRTPAG